jgi:uncharacterized protein (TIGR02246 family)
MAIEALLHEYAARIDAGDFAGVADLFRDGAIALPDGTVVAEGRDAVLRLYENTTKRHADGTPCTKHVVTNVVVEVADDGASATARSYFTVLQATDLVRLQPIVAGRYHDRFAADGDGWHFTERVMHVDLVGDVSDHLLIELSGG